MLKKVLVAGAVGVSVFGVAAASASSLNDVFAHGSTVQQSDDVSATCTQGAYYANVVKGGEVTAVHFAQQFIEHSSDAYGATPGCEDDTAQVVWTVRNADGSTSKVYSDRFQIPNKYNAHYGYDIYLPPESAVSAQNLVSTQVTIAGEIASSQGNQADNTNPAYYNGGLYN